MKLPYRRRPAPTAETAMTPMIDVVFLLLIFFVCTASFQQPEEILPSRISSSAGNAPANVIPEDIPLEQVLITTSRQGEATQWSVNEQPCPSLAAVETIVVAVHDVDPTLPVILDNAAEVPLGDVIDVFDLCRRVGFAEIGFAAEVTP